MSEFLSYHILSNDSSLIEHLGCFHLLAIINKSFWTWMHKYVCIHDFSYFLYIPRIGTAGLYGNFCFLWGIVMLFPSMAIPFYIVPHSNFSTFLPILSFSLFLPFFLTLSSSLPYLMVIALLTGAEWYLTVVLVCIFLMVSYILHHSMCLLIICISLEKCLFKSFVHFLMSLLVFELG